MIQSFGPEARGSACSSTVTVCDTEVLYPYIHRPDVFVVMSTEGYEKYRDELKDDGILVYEKDLVQPRFKPGQPAFGCPSTRLAETLGRAIVQNIVMLGFFAAVTKIVPREAMRNAVKDSVPAGTEDLNLRAFDAGWDHFEREHGVGATAPSQAEAAAEVAGSAGG
jgi:2-oxoglutarate ferredoxin oxidoreductase subunit gamma